MQNSRSKIFSEIKESLELLKKEVSVLEDRLTLLESVPEDGQQPDDLPIAEAPVFVSESLEASEKVAVQDDDISAFFTDSEPETVGKLEFEPELSRQPELEFGLVDGLVSEESASEPFPEEPVSEQLSDVPVAEPILPEVESNTETDLEHEIAADPLRQEGTLNDTEASSVKLSIADSLRAKRAWRIDRPGSPVRNILSAISLNDRVIFIHTLFSSDPILFQNTISKLNEMSNFNDAESYLLECFKEWDFNSDVVYRFMMAVRRKHS